MRFLSFDTAGPVIGVAFGDVERVERVTRGAEGRLLPWAEELSGGLGNVDAIAVAIGPGAFTGVRVGLAHAQGLAHALDLPLIGIGSLASRGAAVGATLALLDARKGRVYAGWAGEEFAPVDWTVADVLAHGAERGWVVPGFRCVGEGAVVYRDELEAAGGIVVDHADHPSPASIGRLAAERLSRDPAQGRQPVLPVYVRPPDAVPPRRGV